MTREREVILDTETTGLDPAEGHRVVEIGCLELLNHVPTGRTFHTYVNPERYMPGDALSIHGLTEEFLAKQPVFAAVSAEFLGFVADATIVAHNAKFDLGFINAEMRRLDRPPLRPARVIDTVDLARRKFPGAQASLDALCKRFNVDTSARTKHGSLLDAALLSEVYIELLGGRQATLVLGAEEPMLPTDSPVTPRQWPDRLFEPTPEELAAHAAFVQTLDNPIWLKDVGAPAQI
ncbi:MAG: DNA polymerase III subunit epsilon [Alphaproteobacteria bacterium]|nr:DNA polymerase III subunit epsilon [Alphaproteobacteria bacterium]